jgi:membrane associated rhomboid family serine protease
MINTGNSGSGDNNDNNDESNQEIYARMMKSARNFVLLILGINFAVFLAWRSAESSRDMGKVQFMLNNFTVSLRNLREGRIHTLITSAFSQRDFMHLAMNSIALYYLGEAVCLVLGKKQFSLVYLCGGMFSSLSHVIYTAFILPRIELNQLRKMRQEVAQFPSQFSSLLSLQPQYHDTPALGASGSAMACATLFACLFPHQKFLIYFVLPVPAYLAVGLMITYDLYSGLTQPNSHVGHFAHLGGAAFGGMYYWLRLRRGRMWPDNKKFWRGREI